MTTKDKENDAENQNSSDEPEGDGASEGVETEVQDYVLALNKFTQLVSEMEWPDHLAIDNDTDLCIRMFRTYWQQRMRQQREQGRAGHRHHVRFGPFDEEKFKHFIRGKFKHHFFEDEDDEPVYINPEEHAPDEEHLDDEAKERQQRFRDEWE